MDIVNNLISFFLLYFAIGFLFALYFAFKGAGKIDEGAKEVTLTFRLLIFPASIALWPFLLKKVMTK
jgi:hypothetical protein